MKSKGVRMVFRLDHATNIFHNFAEYLYGNNMVEQQNWEPGKYFLSSLNFGGLEDTSSFEVLSMNIHFVQITFRTYFSMIHLLEWNAAIFLSLPPMTVTTASGWFTTGTDKPKLLSPKILQSRLTLSWKAPKCLTLTLSACTPSLTLTAPTSSSVSSHKLKETLRTRAIASMPISPAVQVSYFIFLSP